MAISNYIHGRRVPDHETQVAIETLFGVAREGWSMSAAPETSRAPDPAEPDLSDDECEQLDAELRGTMACLGLTLPCSPADLIAALQRDAPPAQSQAFEIIVAPLAPAPRPSRPSKGRPTHPWVRGCMAKEVAAKGYDAAQVAWLSRSNGYSGEFIERDAHELTAARAS